MRTPRLQDHVDGGDGVAAPSTVPPVHPTMPLKCFSLLLGARNTPRAGQRFTPADEEQIRAITFRHFPDGFTVLNADGGWFDPVQQRFVEEESRQILVLAKRRADLRPWCADLAIALNQKELLVVEVGSATTFRRPR